VAGADDLTVLSINLWHDWPRHRRWRQRLESVALLVEHESADLVLLQEVARTRRLAADRWLADRLGMHDSYQRANGDRARIGFEEGVAVLSRFPLGPAHGRRLSAGRNPFVRRVALAVPVQAPTGPVLAVSAHLGLLAAHNARQVEALRAWVASVSGGEVAVVGGDFNAPEHRRSIAHTTSVWTDTFRHRHPTGPAPTHRRRRPWQQTVLTRRLDYVFVAQPPDRHWLVTDAHHLDAPGGPASDHLAVLARLRPVGTDGGPDGTR
jgi:endonuclease/exonuclease/phosphatase family metal-dependent hydrolase